MEGLRGRDLRGRKMSGATISRPQLYTFHVLSPLICTTTQSGGVEGSAILRPISQTRKLRPLKNQDPLAQFGCELEEDDDFKGAECCAYTGSQSPPGKKVPRKKVLFTLSFGQSSRGRALVQGTGRNLDLGFRQKNVSPGQVRAGRAR